MRINVFKRVAETSFCDLDSSDYNYAKKNIVFYRNMASMAALYNNFGRRLINKHTEWPSHQRKFDRNFKMAALVDCLERMNSQKSLKVPFISQILNSVFSSFFFILSISGEKKEEQAKINFVATVKDLMYIDRHRTLVH